MYLCVSQYLFYFIEKDVLVFLLSDAFIQGELDTQYRTDQFMQLDIQLCRTVRLTSNPHVRLLALLSSCSAPSNTLAPVVLQTKDLLHLLPRDINLHLHYWQTYTRMKWVKSGI